MKRGSRVLFLPGHRHTDLAMWKRMSEGIYPYVLSWIVVDSPVSSAGSASFPRNRKVNARPRATPISGRRDISTVAEQDD